MPDLFTGSLDQIALADVERFLNLQGPESARPIEGPRLDYKSDLPQDIGRDVAALANTYGGVLLVGVQTKGPQRNIPDKMLGADLGPDPRARLTDLILATVHPRPEFEIRPLKIANSSKPLAIIRVNESTFPPSEFTQGATTSIPVRIEDSTRQATLRQIEALLKKRDLASTDSQQVAEKYLIASDFFCSEEATGNPDPQFHQVLRVQTQP